jgi:hypothetical protein
LSLRCHLCSISCASLGVFSPSVSACQPVIRSRWTK